MAGQRVGPHREDEHRLVAADEEHDDMLAWLGLEKPGDFDPYGFDVDTANHALTAVGAAR